MFFITCFLLFIAQCNASNFWIESQVIDLAINNECLAKSCFINDLQFHVSHFAPRFNESTQFKSSVTKAEKQFTSTWMDGLPEDVKVQLSIVNHDPSYGFPRVCDISPEVSVLNVPQVSASDFQVFHLQARCFNATIILQKHEQNCPWCQDAAIGVQQKLLANMPWLHHLTDPVILVPVIIAAVLLIIVLGLVVALICVLGSKSTTSIKSIDDTYEDSILDHSSSETSGSIIFSTNVPTLPITSIPSKPYTLTMNATDDKYYAVVLDV